MAEQDTGTAPPAPPTMDELRGMIRDALADDLRALRGNPGHTNYGLGILAANLARAYRDLGGDLELEEVVSKGAHDSAVGEAKRQSQRRRALEVAVRDLLEPIESRHITAEDFPPRLEALRAPLNRLAEVLEDRA